MISPPTARLPSRAPEAGGLPTKSVMSQSNLIALAESCSGVRAAVGRMLLSGEESPERTAAADHYRRALRNLLRLAREEECGLYLEIAGELATRE
jgi:hypothetical protein